MLILWVTKWVFSCSCSFVFTNFTNVFWDSSDRNYRLAIYILSVVLYWIASNIRSLKMLFFFVDVSYYTRCFQNFGIYSHWKVSSFATTDIKFSDITSVQQYRNISLLDIFALYLLVSTISQANLYEYWLLHRTFS